MASALLRFGRSVLSETSRGKFATNYVPFIFCSSTLNKVDFNYTNQSQSWFDKQFSELNNATTVEQLFTSMDKYSLSTRQTLYAFEILKKWVLEGKVNINEFINDSRFLENCNIIKNGCHRMNHNSLIIGLRNLLQIGLPPEMEIVKFLENETLWNIRKMNLRTLITCLNFHKHYQETELQKNVVKELIRVIQNRWYEITDFSDVIKILENADLFSEKYMCKTEDQMLEYLEKATVDELQKLLICLSHLKRRSTPVLRAISYHMNRCSEKLSVKKLINMLFALNVLCFPDTVLLQKISNDLLVEIPNITKPQLISTLLLSIGQLSWRNKSILEACSDWMIKNLNICRPQEIATYVLTLARVNYHPIEINTIFQLLLPHLNQETFQIKRIWLDIVWSLAILNKATKNHLLSVLEPSFYSSLIENDNYQSHHCKLKLLNVKSVAIIEHQLLLSNLQEPLLSDIQLKKSDEGQQLTKSIIDSLSDIIPIEKYMITDVSTVMGFPIGAEFIINKNGKPLPIETYGIRSGLKNITKALPSDIFRIALLVWEFKDFTLDNECLTGPNALAIRLLKKLGYTILEIPYIEYDDKLTPVKKAQYFQSKMKQVIKQN